MAEERKIIVDEDWKEEAQREKEALAKALEEEKSPKAFVQQPSFTMLLSGLAAQAIAGLGDLPNPLTGTADVNLDEAKFHIDLLEIIEQKTKGNLSDAEAQMLKGLLFDLRMRFVEKQRETTQS